MTVLVSSNGQLDGGFRRGVAAVRVRPGEAENPHSKLPESDWGTADESTLTRVAIAPVASDDVNAPNGRWIESTMALYSRNYNLDVKPRDRIVYGGTTYDVTGEVARWQNPYSGRKRGAVFGLKAIT